MAEADLKKAGGITGAIDISDRCSRLIGELCFAGSAIDPRAIRALAFLTDSVNVTGSSVNATILGTPTVDVTDRAVRLLGIVYGNLAQLQQRAATLELLVQLTSAGIQIDPRQIRNLVFATDKVDASGSSVTTASGSVVTMDDAFMELRLMADYLKDLAITIDSSGRIRTFIDTVAATALFPVSDITSIGNQRASGFIFDEMDIVFNTGIRPQII